MNRGHRLALCNQTRREQRRWVAWVPGEGESEARAIGHAACGGFGIEATAADTLVYFC
jgi:hypothetical protein